MKLLTLHENLYYGELANLIDDGNDVFPGTLPVRLANQVGSYLKQALTQIYSRFILLEKEVVVEAQDSIYLYYLQTQYAMSDPTITVKYLRDTVDDPFLEDVIRIEEIYDETGERVALNDPESATSFFTPKFDCLQIPAPVTGAAYTVLYQADHPVIDLTDMASEIMLPSYLEIALRAYISFLLLGSKNGEHVARAMEHLSRYETICEEIESRDLLRTSQPNTDNKFNARGFK